MTPEQKLKHMVLLEHAQFGNEIPSGITAETVDAIYESVEGDDYNLQDAREEIRGGQVMTGLKCEYSRHYESKGVAAKAPDGSWVGWTYWSGGGKHGEPEAIDWMEYAYDLDCVEEEKMVVVRTFTKIESAQAPA